MTATSHWQFTSIISYAKVVGDASPTGDYTFRDSSNKDTAKALRLDLGHQWKSWQIGMGASFLQKNRQSTGTNETSSGMGDVFIYGTRAIEIDYEKFYPLFNIRIPTAPSNYNSASNLQTDARGAGVLEISTGLLWIHGEKTWDTQVAPTFFYRFSRSFNQNDKINVSSQTGGALMLGAGIVPWQKKYRLGTAVTPRYEGSKKNKSQWS